MALACLMPLRKHPRGHGAPGRLLHCAPAGGQRLRWPVAGHDGPRYFQREPFVARTGRFGEPYGGFDADERNLRPCVHTLATANARTAQPAALSHDNPRLD
jgi:hypothetical protein